MHHHPWVDALQGGLGLLGGVLGAFYHALFPVLSFTAVACGAILGLHGVWRLLHGKAPK